MKRKRGRPPKGAKAMNGAERVAAHRKRKAVERGGGPKIIEGLIEALATVRGEAKPARVTKFTFRQGRVRTPMGLKGGK